MSEKMQVEDDQLARDRDPAVWLALRWAECLEIPSGDFVNEDLRFIAREIKARDADVARLRDACSKSNDEICQTLGRALGYPRYCDDQANFPGSTDANGVCVGEHVAESLAMEAAQEIVRLRTICAETGIFSAPAPR